MIHRMMNGVSEAEILEHTTHSRGQSPNLLCVCFTVCALIISSLERITINGLLLRLSLRDKNLPHFSLPEKYKSIIFKRSYSPLHY